MTTEQNKIEPNEYAYYRITSVTSLDNRFWLDTEQNKI